MTNFLKKHLQTVYLLLFVLVHPFNSKCQNRGIIESGTIEFERSENVYFYLDNYYGTLEGDMKKYADEYKNNNPKFKLTSFVLEFDINQSVFIPKSNSELKIDFLSQYSSENNVRMDFRKQTYNAQKNILGVNYLLNDPIKKINWKLTGETREIAGFLCRRANGLVSDSIYVVAFYTDQIIPKGGPESFAGLPGMILGIALPNEHITWFAKNYSPDRNMQLLSTSKLAGKKVTNYELEEIFKKEVAIKPSSLLNFIRRRSLF
ncbi:GLPGLI family protein [Pedobacter polaris]|uniref:GLPGLI family protein n=1 Tax=Pedobacter polaris TaxID=2571273 RepID=A0A4U1CTB1_9SPHI|nr:GLPGLI family protein [Pedobacter polaris]TKC12411.1 GLPGLI family protein [Pedobacter polaris]